MAEYQISKLQLDDNKINKRRIYNKNSKKMKNLNRKEFRRYFEHDTRNNNNQQNVCLSDNVYADSRCKAIKYDNKQPINQCQQSVVQTIPDKRYKAPFIPSLITNANDCNFNNNKLRKKLIKKKQKLRKRIYVLQRQQRDASLASSCCCNCGLMNIKGTVIRPPSDNKQYTPVNLSHQNTLYNFNQNTNVIFDDINQMHGIQGLRSIIRYIVF